MVLKAPFIFAKYKMVNKKVYKPSRPCFVFPHYRSFYNLSAKEFNKIKAY